jgi:hypothetical protein
MSLFYHGDDGSVYYTESKSKNGYCKLINVNNPMDVKFAPAKQIYGMQKIFVDGLRLTPDKNPNPTSYARARTLPMLPVPAPEAYFKFRRDTKNRLVDQRNTKTMARAAAAQAMSQPPMAQQQMFPPPNVGSLLQSSMMNATSAAPQSMTSALDDFFNPPMPAPMPAPQTTFNDIFNLPMPAPMPVPPMPVPPMMDIDALADIELEKLEDRFPGKSDHILKVMCAEKKSRRRKSRSPQKLSPLASIMRRKSLTPQKTTRSNLDDLNDIFGQIPLRQPTPLASIMHRRSLSPPKTTSPNIDDLSDIFGQIPLGRRTSGTRVSPLAKTSNFLPSVKEVDHEVDLMCFETSPAIPIVPIPIYPSSLPDLEGEDDDKEEDEEEEEDEDEYELA